MFDAYESFRKNGLICMGDTSKYIMNNTVDK